MQHANRVPAWLAVGEGAMKRNTTILLCVLAALTVPAYAQSTQGTANAPNANANSKNNSRQVTFSGGTVSCVDKDVSNGPVVWSYVINTTNSARLGSDITYDPGTGAIIISALNVAQYEALHHELFMMIDDVNQNYTMTFEAGPRESKPFGARLRLFDSNETLTSTLRLSCTVTP
jgi:hypothetical protein